LQRTIKIYKTMIEKQILDSDLPQWEKDFIDTRLNLAQQHPERLKPIEKL